MCGHYASLIGRGMTRTSALIVIAKKLLRIIHAMLRDDREQPCISKEGGAEKAA